MPDDEGWNPPPEDEGITLGPEEALDREIAKSKSLKVERLKLRNRIETLEQEKSALVQENEALKASLTRLKPGLPDAPPARSVVSSRWVWFMVVFNLAALALLFVITWDL